MPEELDFATFFTMRLKERGYTLKKLAEASGVSLKYLEQLSVGDYSNLPSAPYFHGYLLRISEVLGFDAEAWWVWFKKEGIVKTSGSGDTLPKNRFVKKFPSKYILVGIVVSIIAIFGVFRIGKILGRPILIVSTPEAALVSVFDEELIIRGSVENADALTINSETIPISSDGSFEKKVLLQPGPNTFEFSVKKFLGKEVKIVRQINYEPMTVFEPVASSSQEVSTSSVQ